MVKNYKNTLLKNKSLKNNTLSILTFFAYKNSNSKIIYVDSLQFCDNFNITKELKKSTDKKINLQKTKVDFSYPKLHFSETYLPRKKVVMQQFNKYYVAEQSSKTQPRIKSYSSEFYRENKYPIIIGLEHSILFDDENIDVTNDTLTYINKKYEGLK